MYGNNVIVGGISGPAALSRTPSRIQGSRSGTLTVNSPAGSSSSYSGYLRNTNNGSGSLTLVKNGAGSLTLSGSNVGGYTGGLVVNAGMSTYSGGTTPNCNYTINGGTLNLGTTTRTRNILGLHLTGGSISGSLHVVRQQRLRSCRPARSASA